MKLTRFSAIFATLLLSAAASDTPPNIVLLYSDDAGFADFGFQPNCRDDVKQLTPRISSIAKEGVRLTNGYMSGCVCSPSRAGMMTGRYQGRFGYDNNLPPGTESGLSLEETFGVKRLQKLGYETALIGKWHLGYPDEYHPNKRGFDLFHGLLQGSRPYFPMPKPTPHRVIQRNGKPTDEIGYVTDRLGDAACDFIKANKERPFFVFLSFTAPHGPLQPKPEDAAKLSSIEKKGRRNYAGLLVSLDANVGKVLDCLKSEGLEDNTIVIFTNDNGGQTQLGANNFPLKGKKGQLTEGGVRVPWAIRWPGKIKPGSVIDDPIISLDLVPTFVEAAGAAIEDSWKLDGVPLTQRLQGCEALAERPLFWRQHGSSGNRSMRLGNWKLHHNRKAGLKPELYDLSADIGEKTDLAGKEPEQVKKMLAQLDAWESELTEPLWGPGATK
ncbi:arylsulfatase [Haloferula helveola]|uniref:Arylsulfatase n=1 Tax=Haloferula helveola TaxID=490095 RepID=A0ABN6H521_9BACT|nr:arylsulfatase [Haloferula helveola]